MLKVRLSLKRAYVGAGLKRVLEWKKRFTKKLQALLPWLEGEKGAKVTKNKISRQSRIVPELIFQVTVRANVLPTPPSLRPPVTP